jgi:hypothetical protein
MAFFGIKERMVDSQEMFEKLFNLKWVQTIHLLIHLSDLRKAWVLGTKANPMILLSATSKCRLFVRRMHWISSYTSMQLSYSKRD